MCKTISFQGELQYVLVANASPEILEIKYI